MIRLIGILLFFIATAAHSVTITDSVKRWFIQSDWTVLAQSDSLIGLNVTKIELTVTAPALCDMNIGSISMRLNKGSETARSYYQEVSSGQRFLPKGTRAVFTSPKLVSDGTWDYFKIVFKDQNTWMDCPGGMGRNEGTRFADTMSFRYWTSDGVERKFDTPTSIYSQSETKMMRDLYATIKDSIMINTLTGREKIVSSNNTTVRIEEFPQGDIILNSSDGTGGSVHVYYDASKGELSWDFTNAKAGQYSRNVTARLNIL